MWVKGYHRDIGAILPATGAILTTNIGYIYELRIFAKYWQNLNTPIVRQYFIQYWQIYEFRILVLYFISIFAKLGENVNTPILGQYFESILAQYYLQLLVKRAKGKHSNTRVIFHTNIGNIRAKYKKPNIFNIPAILAKILLKNKM